MILCFHGRSGPVSRSIIPVRIDCRKLMVKRVASYTLRAHCLNSCSVYRFVKLAIQIQIKKIDRMPCSIGHPVLIRRSFVCNPRGSIASGYPYIKMRYRHASGIHDEDFMGCIVRNGVSAGSFVENDISWDGRLKFRRYLLKKQVGIPIPTAFAQRCRVWKPDLQSTRYLDLLRNDFHGAEAPDFLKQNETGTRGGRCQQHEIENGRGAECPKSVAAKRPHSSR